MDGSASGRWQVSLSNWNGRAYKIPHGDLKSSSNLEYINTPGVYFLFGKDDATDKQFIYIGEADETLKRLLQPHTFEKDGTYCFEAVWEKMIDQVFGNVDKTDYFPRGRWHFEENDDDQDAEKEDWTSYSHLTPDTIMKTEDGLFILDAKYYKYGITGKTADLPATSSITKQIIYGEYAESQNSEMKGKIYNAFLIPYDGKTDSSINEMKYIGYAYDEWKKEKQKTEWASYDRIYTFLLDTRTLMQMSIGQEDKSQELRKLASRILEIKDR